jgi:GNAT superfamily N-acetyltransferase
VSDKIKIEAMREVHLPDVVSLIGRQQARWHTLDTRLREPRDAEQLAREVERILADPEWCALVALDEREVLGCAVMGVRELPPESEALAFMGSRDGAVRLLALPGPDEPYPEPIANALFDGIENWWDGQQATGASIFRPLCDTWLWPLLERRGWLWVAVSALRPAEPLPPSSRQSPTGTHTRLARPEDEEAVIRLHVEDYQYHADHDPTVRMVPGVELEMRQTLSGVWAAGQGPEETGERRFRVFVVEHGDELVAMSITYLYFVTDESPGVFRTGRYCHIGSTGVRADIRGKGVGRLLVEGITQFYEPLGVQAYSLAYHLRNQLSSAFWPRLGWVPVMGRYIKRETLRR